jgi:hemoglobin-like flavoprotein
MLTETITLQVESDIARLYNDAPQTDKEKLQALFETCLKQYAEADVDSLKATMDEISRKAQDRGLTPEILESLLADE